MPALQKILVPFDFSDDGRQALRTALHLAYRFESELLILTVIERNPDNEAMKAKLLPKDAESQLKKKIQEETHSLISWGDRRQFRFRPMVQSGKAAVEILLAAEKEVPDLIVMGTRGKTGLKQVFLGSVAEKVVRQSAAPVWVCRGSSHRLPGKILMPVDFSEYCGQTLDQVFRWAEGLNAELFLLHVVDLLDLYTLDLLGVNAGPSWEVELKNQAEERLRSLASSIPLPAKLEVRLGNPIIEIQAFIQENSIDLAILPTHGRTGLKRLMMGSVAEQAVRYSSCSVMTIRPPALVSSSPKIFEGEKDLEDYIRSFRD